EALRDAVEDRRWPELASPCCDELDREWQTIQSNAQLGDRLRVLRSQLERLARRARPLKEQGDGCSLGEAIRRRQVSWIRDGKRRHLERSLPPEAQGLTARRQYHDEGTFV